MSFDLLSTIELTASAAIMIATLAFTLAATTRGRIEAAAALAAWFVLVVFLGATLVLNVGPPPALAAAVILPVLAMCAAFFSFPSIKAAAMAMPLPALEAVHAARVLGISFVLLYAADCRLGRYFCRRRRTAPRLGDEQVRRADADASAGVERARHA
jgi:hypothetical protein